jgi:hypothetical protein
MIISSSYVVLNDGEVLQLMLCLFDKSLVTARPDSMPAPYCSENHPPSVRIFVFFDIIFFCY